MRWPWQKKKPKQYTWCFCPGCKADLCSNGSFVEDTDLVRYTCTVCGWATEWNFDIAPCPILFTVNGERVVP